MNGEPISERGTSPDRSVTGAGGMVIVGDVGGDPAGRPVVLLHGTGQTRHSWRETAAVLGAAGFRTVTVDLRGHGDTGWVPDRNYHMSAFVEDLRAVVASLPAPPILVGASLGGVIAILTEARYRLSHSLVIVDVAPRVEPDGATRIKAFLLDTLDGFESLEEASVTVAQYRGRPSTGGLEGLRKNLRLHDDGRYRWHWDPYIARHTPMDSMAAGEFEAATRSVSVPTLLVRGRQSDILSEAGAREFLSLVRHAEYVDIDAGHMVSGDRNDVFTAAVVDFALRYREQGRSA